MSLSRVVTVIGSTAVFAVVLFGCGEDDRFDPSGSAERGIREQIYVELELASEVDCGEPPSTDVGATFECLATDEEGHTYTFVAKILPDEVIGTRLD